MKIIYIVDFPIDGNSGKKKATREKKDNLKEILGENNLVFYSQIFSRKSVLKIFSLPLFDLYIFLNQIFKKGDYVVIMRVLFLPLSRLLFLFKRVPVFTEFHADFKEEIPLLNKSALEKGFLHIASFFFYLNYKLSDGIIYNHPYLKNKFDKVYKKKSVYAYNGSNNKDFHPIAITEARKQLNLRTSGNDMIFLFLGSISQWHGVDYLIDIFNQKIISDKKIYLYIVGAKNNAYVNDLKTRVLNERIIFKDAVPLHEAELYINASNFCMLPVRQNRTSPGSPLKLYDYISCGKPIITQQNVLGYSDEVIKYNLGFVTDFTNSEKAANDILKIIDQEDRTEFFLRNNTEVAHNKVSWKERMSEWLRFIESAI